MVKRSKRSDETPLRFETELLRPKHPSDGSEWAFVVLPRAVSARLPRRGRTTVDVILAGYRFQVMLEPDGKRSHWMRLDAETLAQSGARIGEVITLDILPSVRQPEPAIPSDVMTALRQDPKVLATWNATTTLARVDWIHWIESAKQDKTRIERIANACDMMAGGKKRVCCFDPSGFYSKAFCAPEAWESVPLRFLSQ